MSKNVKVFFSAFLLSLPFWWGLNLSQEKLAANQKLLLAQISQEENLEKLKPIRASEIKNLEIEAESATSVFISGQGDSEKILFEKNSQRPLPIASLAKLMTANIALEHYDIQDPEIARLLYPLLITSDNNAARDLAKLIGEEAFVDLMNLEAKKLGLTNTNFVNPTGLDPKNPTDPINYSTAGDLAKFAKYLTLERPLIWEISAANNLLEEFPGIIGGKTGETPQAGGCLLLILQAPEGKGYIINVILNSENRFAEMERLIDWSQYAYKW